MTKQFTAACILQQVTGQTYEEYMKKNIFEVCGMQSSTNTEVGNITSVPANVGEYMAAARGSRAAGGYTLQCIYPALGESTHVTTN